MNDILEAISNVGFPIVAFILMYYKSTKTIRENTRALRDLCIHIKK